LVAGCRGRFVPFDGKGLVAIVGAGGTGKSTMTKQLLLRFYDPTAWQILLGWALPDIDRTRLLTA
jgi:ABC-type multidrug transport system fused ATPase/permease subunit